MSSERVIVEHIENCASHRDLTPSTGVDSRIWPSTIRSNRGAPILRNVANNLLSFAQDFEDSSGTVSCAAIASYVSAPGRFPSFAQNCPRDLPEP